MHRLLITYPIDLYIYLLYSLFTRLTSKTQLRALNFSGSADFAAVDSNVNSKCDEMPDFFSESSHPGAIVPKTLVENTLWNHQFQRIPVTLIIFRPQ